jgi:hypothetical protein
MPTKSVLKSLVLLFAVALLAVAGACSTDSPTSPERPPATPPGSGGGATAFNVTVTADPPVVQAGSDDPVVITVRAVRADNGQPAANGTLAVVSALAGTFGAPDGPGSVTIELFNGVGQVTFFPPASQEGAVAVRASVAGSVGQVTVQVQGTATFFVSHVTPASGSPQGGDTVAIVGNGFDGPVRVLFGGTNAVVLSVSPTRITVRTPVSPGAPNATTTVPVTVTINLNEEDEATDTVAGAFTYAPGGGEVRQPTIFSVTPTTGQNEGGTPVSIIGEGFQSPVQVEFGNASVFLEAQIASVSANRIEVRSPAATGFGASLRDQPVSIRVTNLNSGLTVVRADAFRYGVQFQVTGLQPDVVDAQSPALVTIFGSGFESPLQVLVGGVQQQVVSVTGTQVVFRPSSIPITNCPPSGTVFATRGVTVRLLSSGAESTPPFSLNFTADVARPVITGVSPNSGPAGGGTTVNLNGSGFQAPVRVLFGGNQAPLQSTSANQVRVTSPAFTGEFPTEACTATGGVPGTRQRPVSVNVSLTNLDTGCVDVVPGGFIYQPPATCVPNEAPPPPPQCSDGIDNDGDGLIDFPADPQCSSADDNDESA